MNLFCLLFYSSRQTNQIRPFVFWENLWVANLLFGFIWPLERRIMMNSVVYFSASNYWVSSCPPRIVAGPQSTNASTSCEYYSTLVFWYMPGLIIYLIFILHVLYEIWNFWMLLNFKQLYEFKSLLDLLLTGVVGLNTWSYFGWKFLLVLH